jgi:hypothetical protein
MQPHVPFLVFSRQHQLILTQDGACLVAVAGVPELISVLPRAVSEPKPPSVLPVSSLKNSLSIRRTAQTLLLIYIFTSYPRLTLDFHTNKRIIDEVVSSRVQLVSFFVTQSAYRR